MFMIFYKIVKICVYNLYVRNCVFIIPYPPSVYNIDYDRVKELSNRIYIQREEYRKNLDKLHALRTTIKNLTKDIQNLVSLKYLCEYETTIKETYEEYFSTETVVKIEIVKYYIDNLYVSSSSSYASSSIT